MSLKSTTYAMCAIALCMPNAALAGPRTAADKVADGCKGSDAACLERALTATDAGLADTASKARATIGGGALTGDDLIKALEQFDASETAWAASRKAQCEAYELYAKAIGDDAAKARWRCLVNEAFNRRSVLRELFSSE
jgi:uncharacterized protein YecT (DUF1311 family)